MFIVDLFRRKPTPDSLPSTPESEIHNPETRTRLKKTITARVIERIKFVKNPPLKIVNETVFRELLEEIDFMFLDSRKYIAYLYKDDEFQYNPRDKETDLTIELARGYYYQRRQIGGASKLTETEAKQILAEALQANGFISEESLREYSNYYYGAFRENQ